MIFNDKVYINDKNVIILLSLSEPLVAQEVYSFFKST